MSAKEKVSVKAFDAFLKNQAKGVAQIDRFAALATKEPSGEKDIRYIRDYRHE